MFLKEDFYCRFGHVWKKDKDNYILLKLSEHIICIAKNFGVTKSGKIINLLTCKEIEYDVKVLSIHEYQSGLIVHCDDMNIYKFIHDGEYIGDLLFKNISHVFYINNYTIKDNRWNCFYCFFNKIKVTQFIPADEFMIEVDDEYILIDPKDIKLVRPSIILMKNGDIYSYDVDKYQPLKDRQYKWYYFHSNKNIIDITQVVNKYDDPLPSKEGFSWKDDCYVSSLIGIIDDKGNIIINEEEITNKSISMHKFTEFILIDGNVNLIAADIEGTAHELMFHNNKIWTQTYDLPYLGKPK